MTDRPRYRPLRGGEADAPAGIIRPNGCARTQDPHGGKITQPTDTRNGYITYAGRIDDVFKAQDYRISPFEPESVRPGDHPHRFRP
jgi:hypothetical protein